MAIKRTNVALTVCPTVALLLPGFEFLSPSGTKAAVGLSVGFWRPVEITRKNRMVREWYACGYFSLSYSLWTGHGFSHKYIWPGITYIWQWCFQTSANQLFPESFFFCNVLYQTCCLPGNWEQKGEEQISLERPSYTELLDTKVLSESFFVFSLPFVYTIPR